jgi:exopolyphosphatase/guanosine-5'-triphosphate,3'-diphosphate pyrophosphatase
MDVRHEVQVALETVAGSAALWALHGLLRSSRPLLESAALLHDIGHAVSYQRHHKHAYYLIQNADLPGIAERERELIARIARYHRRSAPELAHPGMQGLSRSEALLVRRLATLLRVADALDRSHHQAIRKLRVEQRGGSVFLRLGARVPLDLELWDVEREAALFRRVFGKPLEIRS